MSDELIEAMARELAKADNIEICSDASYALSSYGLRARALLPIIRAHLEPTSEMVEAGVDAILTSKERPAIISQHDALAIAFPAMLAASPLGEVR